MLKKCTGFFALITILAISLLGIQKVSAENMIINSGFEDGTLNGWKTEGDKGAIVIQKDAHSGTYAFEINSNIWESRFCTIYPAPELEAGTEYQFSFWYKVNYTGGGEMPAPNPNGYDSFLLYIRSYLNGSDVHYLSTPVTGGTVIRDGEWHQVVRTFTPKEGNTSINQLGLRGYANKLPGFEYYFDDFDLRKVGEDHFQNGDFEDPSMIPWIVDEQATTEFAITAEDKYDGEHSLKVDGTGSKSMYQQFAVTENTPYEFLPSSQN
ncbi:carbohydrate binding domain-containing protein [Ructibacterium gallinarum]|uniref:Carbohydrate binding domain-containing protein n=1 Tax=Ructibacterium gallinarum TaxID=2779355 RepID=A0A9D5M5V6_9FIRM|nr:carbohydrate binding domain-containing protein [Ructibacterium gallinarum]MBE5041264.1 carbohydrate binding domain-containing protein [Ructibacterium gallinarum]